MMINVSDLIGETLGSYKIVGKLGQGGMATVFKAHELSLNRMVALKVLSPQLSEDADFIKRFQREAQAAAQLNHPHIVQIYAIGEEKGLHFFSMEYIKGRTLAEIIKEEQPFLLTKTIQVIRQVAGALEEAHKEGMVHRDIKPSNIMIDPAGRAKVTDFGIAHLARSQTKLTREGSVIGTPEYLSPEQCAGKPVDGRSDIYSLGVTFYEILTGKTPYEADTPVSMMLKIVKGDFPPLREVAPDVPFAIQEMVEKMMATDQEERYQNMAQVLAALEAYEKGWTAPVNMIFEAPGKPSIVSRPSRRRALSALAVAAVIVLLLGGAFAAKILYFGEKSPVDFDQIETPVSSAETAGVAGAPESPIPEGGGIIDEGDMDESLSSNDSPVPHRQVAVKGGRKETEDSFSGIYTPNNDTGNSRQYKTGSKSVSQESAGRVPLKQNRPPSNSVLVTTIGGDNHAEFITSYLQSILSRNNLLVIDGPSVAERSLSEVARNHLVITSELLATTTLNYYGRSSELYTVVLTIKAMEPDSGRICAGPFTETVKFTAINSEEKLKEAVESLARQILIELDQ